MIITGGGGVRGDLRRGGWFCGEKGGEVGDLMAVYSERWEGNFFFGSGVLDWIDGLGDWLAGRLA